MPVFKHHLWLAVDHLHPVQCEPFIPHAGIVYMQQGTACHILRLSDRMALEIFWAADQCHSFGSQRMNFKAVPVALSPLNANVCKAAGLGHMRIIVVVVMH